MNVDANIENNSCLYFCIKDACIYRYIILDGLSRFGRDSEEDAIFINIQVIISIYIAPTTTI